MSSHLDSYRLLSSPLCPTLSSCLLRAYDCCQNTVLECIRDDTSATRELALLVIREMIKTRPSFFESYINFTLCRIMEAFKDPVREVAQVCLFLLLTPPLPSSPPFSFSLLLSLPSPLRLRSSLISSSYILLLHIHSMYFLIFDRRRRKLFNNLFLIYLLVLAAKCLPSS